MLKATVFADTIFAAALQRSDWQHHKPLLRAFNSLQFVITPRTTVEAILLFYLREIYMSIIERKIHLLYKKNCRYQKLFVWQHFSC